MTASKIVAAAASGAAGGDTVDVDDLFNTEMYRGTSATNVIDTGLAMGNSNDGGSVEFTTRNSNWINGPASSDFGFGTGNFTIEFFANVRTNNQHNAYVDLRTANESNYMPVIYSDNSGNLYYFVNDGSSTNRITASGAITPGVWYHIAVSKSGSSTKMFVN